MESRSKASLGKSVVEGTSEISSSRTTTWLTRRIVVTEQDTDLRGGRLGVTVVIGKVHRKAGSREVRKRRKRRAKRHEDIRTGKPLTETQRSSR
jgi:hypothetical protein